ncbi:MAG TPA: M28 family peptidase [Thermomicrobiales bacterium]|nr:M28 family peptidase [Thermomicrobiales bacterium]
MSFEDVLRELSAERTWAMIEQITSEIPSRLAGSENSRRMAEYSRDRFAEAGLEARLHEFRGLVSFPEAGGLWLLEPESREIEAHTLGHSASTDGVEGELVYVGSGAESDYAGKDVRGKITLSELSYSPARHEKALIAWQKGSIAQVMMNWGDETNEAVPFGSMKSAWGNPTPETLQTEMPDIPCIGIARTEGLKLKALCEQGPVRVRVSAKADNRWADLAMTSAEFDAGPGQQFLLLGGHQDSWFGPQATDNAAGTACIIELARAFAAHRGELRRGMLCGLWMGHETGTMISSTRFADVEWDRLRERCVGYLQIDQPAMAGTTDWHLSSTDDAREFIETTTREVAPGMPTHWGRSRRTGDSSFFGVGLTNLAGITSFTDEEIRRTALATLGWWHHSIHNTMDKLDKERLDLHLRLYARWVWELLTAPVLPYRYAPMTRALSSSLERLSRIEVPDIDMRRPVELARQLHQRAVDLDARAATARAMGEAVDAGEAGQINAAMLRLARLLVPLISTVNGTYAQDRYGHSWQSGEIPALTPLALLAELDPASERYQTHWVAAIRARNRVADTLELAIEALG